MNGGTGADFMAGGSGDDVYVIDSVGDVVTELSASGFDTIQSSVTYTLSAEVENLALTGSSAISATGNSLSNILTGNSGVNTLDGGAGADTLIGGTGNDIYIVDNIGDIITELSGGGTDTVQSSITHTLGSQVENLTLLGGGASINATGNSLNNTLTGNSGANVLNGGGGLDTMYGGSGADTFQFEAANAYSNIDVIKDFKLSDNDRINLHDLLGEYDPLTELITDFIQITNSGSNSILKVDRDGTGTAYGLTQITTVEGVTGLTDEAALVSSGNLII